MSILPPLLKSSSATRSQPGLEAWTYEVHASSQDGGVAIQNCSTISSSHPGKLKIQAYIGQAVALWDSLYIL